MKDYSPEYGLALYNLACEASCEKEIFEDFRSVNNVFSANPELLRLLSNPRLSANERADVIGKIFGGKINIYLLNMLKILAEKRRCDMIKKCWFEYRDRYCEANKILTVSAASAVEMSEEQKARLVNALAKKTGCEIILECRIDPSCIGGIRLEYGGKRFDASVKRKFASLKRSLQSEY